MNFFKHLEGPELKMPSLHDPEDVRSTGFKPLATMQPQSQWFAMPAPDGSATFTPFKYNKLTTSPDSQRRFGPNDPDSTNR
jgi:hypothetical protein